MTDWRPRCCDCGKYCGWGADQRTVFGCADPENPEPYEPDYWCKRCAKDRYRRLLKGYKGGCRSGDWEKSDAEVRAARRCGLVWVHSEGVVDPSTGQSFMYRYVTRAESERFIPYLEWMGDVEHREKTDNFYRRQFRKMPDLLEVGTL